jgi:hypothetical protein
MTRPRNLFLAALMVTGFATQACVTSSQPGRPIQTPPLAGELSTSTVERSSAMAQGENPLVAVLDQACFLDCLRACEAHAPGGPCAAVCRLECTL